MVFVSEAQGEVLLLYCDVKGLEPLTSSLSHPPEGHLRPYLQIAPFPTMSLCFRAGRNAASSPAVSRSESEFYAPFGVSRSSGIPGICAQLHFSFLQCIFPTDLFAFGCAETKKRLLSELMRNIL